MVLVAAVLSAGSLAALAWRVARTDAADPHRLIGELRVAQWAAILLAAMGGFPIGVAVAHETMPLAHLDVFLGVAYIGIAGWMLQRDPHEALLIGALAATAHALLDIAHRPGWLSPDVAPRWFTIGSASYSVVIAALCYWARRR